MQLKQRGDEVHPISYTVRGAVLASGLSRSRVYELLARGVLKARKDGRKTLVLADSLTAYIGSLPPMRQEK
jgi:hypothetical protein